SAAILLMFLSLDFKNVRIGHNLPAFATPELMSFLAATCGIRPFSAVIDEIDEAKRPGEGDVTSIA
ncbi:hypothetical protein ACSTIL_23635, partial [Vibrio parahaemolyticus]